MKIKKIKNIQLLTDADFNKKNRSEYIIENLNYTNQRQKQLFKKNENNSNIIEMYDFVKNNLISGIFTILALTLVIPLALFYYFSILIKIIFNKLPIYIYIIKPLIDIQEFILILQTNLTLGNQGNYLLSEIEVNNFRNQLNSTNDYYIWEVFFK